MEAINLFLKGLKNTLDYLMFDGQSWTFPTDYIRVLNIDRHGYAATFVQGNTNPLTFNGEEYSLPTGFKFVGQTVCENVCYVFSTKIVGGVKTGQIGCFPSPEVTGNGTSVSKIFTGWGTVRTYKPLCNLSFGGIATDMTTSEFNFDGTILSVESNVTYDSSVNLIFVDGVNPDRIINTGFNTFTGVSTGTVFTEDQFANKILLLPQSNSGTNIALSTITNNGNLKYGNYIVMLRYLTIDFNKTSFIAETRAIQIYEGTDVGATTQGGDFAKNSDKQINLYVTNLDTNYPYYELVYIRYYSDVLSPIQYEIQQVNNYFLISNAYPVINDCNNVIPITLGEILSGNTGEITSKAILQLENRLWRANLTSAKIYDQRLIEFAKRVLPFTKVTEIDAIYDVNAPASYDNADEQYKDYNKTYGKKGYFGGEIYCFTIKYKFKNGLESDAYPIRGISNFNALTALISDYTDIGTTVLPSYTLSHPTENFNGIYQFPSRNIDPSINTSGTIDTYYLYQNNMVRVLGLILEFSKAIAYLNAHTADKNWFNDNVQSVVICRAERKKMLEYQGLSMSLASNQQGVSTISWDCSYVISADRKNNNTWHISSPESANYYPGEYFPYDETDINQDESNFWGLGTSLTITSKVNSIDECLMPIYRGYVPMAMNFKSGSNYRSVCFLDRCKLVNDYYGIYCPDIIFNNNQFSNNITHVQSVGRTLDTDLDYWSQHNAYNYVYVRPEYDMDVVYGSYINTYEDPLLCKTRMIGEKLPVSPTSTNTPFELKKCINIAEGDDQETNTSRFIGIHADDDNTEDIFNRSIYVLPYLALKKTDDTLDNNLSIVNLYSQNPLSLSSEDFKTFYNINAIEFYEITDRFIIDTSLVSPTIKYVYSGDCFVQRVFIKQQWWVSSGVILGGNDGSVGSSYDLSYPSRNPNAASHPYTSDQINYGHGKILSFITENTCNVAMRYDNIANSNSYYPLNYTDTYWSVKPSDKGYMESFLLNNGYNVSLGLKSCYAINFNQPFFTLRYPTRIRYSAINTIGSFIDGYRIWDVDAYRDFELADGEIISLATLHKNLISFQKTSINQHFINEQEQKADITTGKMVIGLGDILSKQRKQLTIGGCQHAKAVVTTPNAIYCVDYLKKGIWEITGASSMSGTIILGAKEISIEKEVDAYLKDVLESLSGDVDMKGMLVDDPFNGIGIVCGYDPKYKEVLFTFLNATLRTDNSNIFVNSEQLYGNQLWEPLTPYYQYAIVKYEDSLYYKALFTNIDNNPIPGTNNVWVKIDINDAVFFEVGLEVNIGDLIYTCVYKDPEQGVIVVSPIHLTINSETIIDDFFIDNTDRRYIGYNYVISHCVEDNSETLVYNETLKQFTSVYPYGTYYWWNVNNDLYSIAPTNYYSTGKISKHNQGEILTFWKNNKTAVLSWIINGMSDKENAQSFAKRFDSFDIVCTKESEVYNVQLDFNTIEYRTDGQHSLQPFTTDGVSFWRDPVWLENKWHIPIDLSQETGIEYQVDSSMKGNYLKVTLSYKNKNIGYIKEVITNFQISFS